MEALIIYLGVLAALFGGLGAFVAQAKGRDTSEGVLLGALFGPLGCLIEALLPTRQRSGAGTRAGLNGDGLGGSTALRQLGLSGEDPVRDWLRNAERR